MGYLPKEVSQYSSLSCKLGEKKQSQWVRWNVTCNPNISTVRNGGIVRMSAAFYNWSSNERNENKWLPLVSQTTESGEGKDV